MFTELRNLLPYSAKLVNTEYYFLRQYRIAFSNVLTLGGKCSNGHMTAIFISLLIGNLKDLFIMRNTNEYLLTRKIHSLQAQIIVHHLACTKQKISHIIFTV
jgi:hypothetical protein